MPVQPIDLIFPLRGLDEAWAYGRQPEGTSPDCQNVIPFDAIDSRARGGQRWGLSKYYPALHNSTNAIQRISSIASVVIGTSHPVDAFTQANGVLDDTDWHIIEQASGPSRWIVSATHPRIVNNKIHIDETDQGFHAGISKLATLVSANYELTANVSIVLRVEDASALLGFRVRVPISYPSTPGGGGQGTVQIVWTTDNPNAWDLNVTLGGSTLVVPMTPGSNDYKDPTWWETERELKLVVFGHVMNLYVDGTLLYTSREAGDPTQVGVGFLLLGGDLDSDATLDNFAFTSYSESERDYRLIVVSGGDIYAGRPSEILTAATSGTNVLATSGRVDMQSLYGNMYFCDGNASKYPLWTADTNTVSAWTASVTAGVLPCSATSTNTTYAIATADAGTKVFTYTGDLTSVISVNDHIEISGSDDNDSIYSVSAISYSDPTTSITVRQTVVDSAASGDIQLADLGCRYIKRYRGRIIMAGLPNDSQNWFMSAADDPLDWDYGATVSATMAVAGNNTDAGKCPDIITCLAPYSDDLMFIGGDHTIWMMRGDPADKGRIDNISYQTGISGPDAYAFDPNGIFYFHGSGTIWRMAPTGVPEPLSRNRLDAIFGAIDLTENTVHLAWDNKQHGLLIFVVPRVEGATTHYFWDERTDSFWKIAFPDAQGPTTVHAFDGDKPDDNAVLLGGWGGYIRQVDTSVTDDDGTAISSYVLYPPIAMGGPLKNTRINSITAVLDEDSDAVVLTLYAEDTVQQAIESSSIRAARSLSAGRTTIINRVSGNAIMVKLSNSIDETTWAVEHLVANVEVTGHTRKKQL